MSTNLAIVVPAPGSGKLAPAKPVEIPTPGEGELLIKVEAAAQNPVDAPQADEGFLVPSFPLIPGWDGAGTVTALGANVSGFAVHDRVAWMKAIGESVYGTYQQYALAKASGVILLPPALSFDDAVTLPSAFYTAAVGMHTLLGVPLPLDQEGKVVPAVGVDEWLLVWGASSSVGAAAVQIAKAAGFNVVATASRANWPYVKSLGADVLLDYHDSDVVEQIKATASLSLAYDAISQPTSTNACIAALSSSGGKIAITLSFSGTSPDSIEVLAIIAPTVYAPGHETELAGLRRLFQALVGEGRLKPHPVKIMPRGLNSIDDGLDLQRQYKISAQKLVYHPQETV